MENVQKHNKIILLITFGLFLRLIFINPVPAPDAASFVIWSDYLHSHRIADLYEFLPNGYQPYPPAYYYVLKFLGFLISFLKIQNNMWFALLLVKIPVFIADIVVGLLIYKLVLDWKKIETKALTASAFYFLHPAVIFTVSVWGQIDSIIICLTMLSILLIVKNKTFAGLMLFTISSLVKLQTFALLPFMIFWLLTRVSPKKLVLYMFSCALLVILLSLPLLLPKGIHWTLSYYYSLPNQYPYTSVYSYSLWALFGFMQSDGIKLFGIPYKYVGIGLFWIISFMILLPMQKRKLHFNLIFFAIFLLWFNFAFFSTRMHSRYLIYSLGFISIFFPRFSKLGIGLSILMLLNLLLPLNNPQYVYVNQILKKQLIVQIFVLYALALFVWSMKIYYQMINAKQKHE